MPKDKSPYEDIIHLPHHVSRSHGRMSPAGRAAQFSPFAALTGFDAEIREAARLTDRRIELDEERKAELDRRLRLLEEIGPGGPAVTFTWFVPDVRKDGGSYVSAVGRLGRLDRAAGSVVLGDGTAIPAEDLLEVEGPLWDEF